VHEGRTYQYVREAIDGYRQEHEKCTNLFRSLHDVVVSGLSHDAKYVPERCCVKFHNSSFFISRDEGVATDAFMMSIYNFTPLRQDKWLRQIPEQRRGRVERILGLLCGIKSPPGEHRHSISGDTAVVVGPMGYVIEGKPMMDPFMFDEVSYAFQEAIEECKQISKLYQERLSILRPLVGELNLELRL
jgi:hypothetical protein